MSEGLVTILGVPAGEQRWSFTLPSRPSLLVALVASGTGLEVGSIECLAARGGANRLVGCGLHPLSSAVSADGFFGGPLPAGEALFLDTLRAPADLTVRLTVNVDPRAVFPPDWPLLTVCERVSRAREGVGKDSPVVLLRRVDMGQLVEAAEQYARHTAPFCAEFGDNRRWAPLPSAGAMGDNALSSAARVLRVALGDPDLAARVEVALSAQSSPDDLEAVSDGRQFPRFDLAPTRVESLDVPGRQRWLFRWSGGEARRVEALVVLGRPAGWARHLYRSDGRGLLELLIAPADDAKGFPGQALETFSSDGPSLAALRDYPVIGPACGIDLETQDAWEGLQVVLRLGEVVDVDDLAMRPRRPRLIVREITFSGLQTFVACDGRCDKAWGLNGRPRRDDDHIGEADGVLGLAPTEPGTWEGGDTKPPSPPGAGETFNRWCVRECERNAIAPVWDRTRGGVLVALQTRLVRLGAPMVYEEVERD